MYPLTAGLIVADGEVAGQLRRSLAQLSVRIVFEIPEIPEQWPDLLDRIERVAPDLLILDTSHLHGSLQEAMTRIGSTRANPAVFALAPVAEPQSILAALRAGVREYLYPPFEEALKNAIERLAMNHHSSSNGAGANGKVLAFLSAKGGCGATTVASQVAVELVRHSTGRVLLADFDLQSGILGFLLKTRSDYNLADVAGNVHRLDPSYWKAVVSEAVPNLDVLAAPVAPSAKIVAPQDAGQVLAFARKQYAWTVVDLGHSLTPFNLSMLELADETYLITTQEIPALHEARLIVQTLLGNGYPRAHLRLVLNRVQKQSEVTQEDLENMIGTPIYAALPGDYLALQESYAEGRLLNGTSVMGRACERLAGRIAGVSEQKKKAFWLFA